MKQAEDKQKMYEFFCKNCEQIILVEDEIESGSTIECNNCFTEHVVFRNHNVFDIEQKIQKTTKRLLIEIRNWLLFFGIIISIFLLLITISVLS